MELSRKEGILTPAQVAFLEAFFESDPPVFLTGGSALSGFYLGHRLSQDLDLFSGAEAGFEDLPALLQKAARTQGAALIPLQTAPTFRRFGFERGLDRFHVDLALDLATPVVAEKPRWKGVRVDAIEDITANKLCTVLGRKESRDYVDLFFLARAGRSLDAALVGALQKDAGIHKAMLGAIMKRFRLPELPAYVLQRVPPEEIERFILDLAERWIVESAPPQSNRP